MRLFVLLTAVVCCNACRFERLNNQDTTGREEQGCSDSDGNHQEFHSEWENGPETCICIGSGIICCEKFGNNFAAHIPEDTIVPLIPESTPGIIADYIGAITENDVGETAQTVEKETVCTIEEESEEENGLMPYPPAQFDELMIQQDTHTSSYLCCLPEKMALLELELSELKQLILSRPNELTIKNLQAEIKDLHNINKKIKAEMSKMKEDSIQRERKLERNIQELKEKLEEQTVMCLQLKNKESESPNNNVSTESDSQPHQEVTSHGSSPPDTATTRPETTHD
ncbi:hypothetical protein ABG768_009953 [Culter alburnus]|uniref:Uncharacterized protein n=1 Tax=Culter alburnus TaxID=194366 RepID=A0AAW1ZEN6_CULAL